MIFKEETIGNISNRIFSGGTPDTRKNDYWNGNLNWLSSGETRNKYIYKTEKNITQLGADNSSTRLAHKGDIVIASAGQGYTRGQTSMLMNDMYINQSLICIECDKSKVNNYYLFYLLSSQYDKLRFVSNENSSRGSLTTKIINEYSVKLPTLENQTKIVNILKALDGKIELNNEINNNLHELAETIFNEYNVNANEDKLDSLIDIVQTGSRPKGGAQSEGIPSIGAEKIEKFGVYDYSTEKYISDDYFKKLKNGIVNSKDVLLYKDGAYTGKSSMALNGFPHSKCAVNEHVFILRTNNLYAQNYLYFTLNNKDVKEKLNMLACGKAAQPGLNQTELKSVDIKLANKDQIIEFENKVSPIMEKIALNSLMNKKLSQLRDTLLPKLMNGEIDLDNIEI